MQVNWLYNFCQLGNNIIVSFKLVCYNSAVFEGGNFILKNLNKKDIILIITYIGIVIFALVNFEKIFGVFGNVINIFSPFILGVILSFVLNVLNNFIERKVFGNIKSNKIWDKIKRPISIMLSLVLVFVIIIFVIYLLIPQLNNSVSLFITSLPEYKEDIVDILNRFDVENDTIEVVSDYLDNFGKVITDFIKDNSEDVITVTTEVVGSIVNVVSKGVISIVFAIYILAQKENLIRQADKVMSAYLKPKTVNKIKSVAILANKTFSSFVTGQCTEALIFGTLCFIGMLILGIPYALTIAVLLGFTALIPIFGAIIGTVLGAVLIFMVSPIKAIIFVVFVLLIQQIDNNLIYPKVVGKSVGLPGMWVLLSVTVGGSVGGLLGLIIATPLCSLVYALVSQAVNDRLKKNKIVEKVEEKKIEEKTLA